MTGEQSNGPATREEIERFACRLVLDDLARRGHDVAELDRPDRVERRQRAVDFRISLDGRAAALEITDLYASEESARAEALRFRLQAALRQILGSAWPRGSGHLVVSFTMTGVPSRRELDSAIPGLIEVIKTAAPMAALTHERVNIEPLPSFLRHLSLNLLPAGRDVVSVVYGGGTYWVDGVVDAFVRWVIDAKTSQTAGWPEAIVAAVDRTHLDAEDVAAGFARAVDLIPANWSYIYLIGRVSDGGSRAHLVFHRGSPNAGVAS